MDSAVAENSSQECLQSSQEPPAKRLKQSSILAFVKRQKRSTASESLKAEEPPSSEPDRPENATASQVEELDGDSPLWPPAATPESASPSLFSTPREGSGSTGKAELSPPDLFQTEEIPFDTQATVFTATALIALQEGELEAAVTAARIEASRERFRTRQEEQLNSELTLDVTPPSQDLFPEGYSQEESEGNMDPEMRERMAAAALTRMTAGSHAYQISPSASEASTEVMSPGRLSPGPETPDGSPGEEDGDADSPSWKGCPLEDISRAPVGSFGAVPLHRNGDEKHSILIKVPVPSNETEIPKPYPEKYRDLWDNAHVNMPCSKWNVHAKDSSSKWQDIKENLSDPIHCVEDLVDAVKEYNPRAVSDPKAFAGLKEYLESIMTKQERLRFFEVTLPAIVQLALKLPEVVTQAPPLLKKGEGKSISLSQYQVACLLANAFLCTFPRRNLSYRQRDHQYAEYPDINFDRLFGEARQARRKEGKFQKLRSIIHYFEKVTKTAPTGVITLTRRHRQEKDLPDWQASSTPITPKVHICAEGVIEVEGKGLLELDFANKFIGGGVMEGGLVQEEIRFVLWPELFVTRLVTERLSDREVLVITGAQQFSRGTGYSDSFKWIGDFDGEHPPSDEYRRKTTQILAMDAISFDKPGEQALPKFLLRELNKAYVGFLTDIPKPSNVVGVATGNWGCGAFRGDPRLKFLLQLMAVCQAGRDGMAYFTFKDTRLRNHLHAMHEFLVEKSITVGRLFRALREFARKDMAIGTLYNFLFHYLSVEEVKQIPKPILPRVKLPSKSSGEDKDVSETERVEPPRKAPIATAESVPLDLEEDDEDEVVPSTQSDELVEVKVHSTEKKDLPGSEPSKRPSGNLWDFLEKEEDKNPVVIPDQ